MPKFLLKEVFVDLPKSDKDGGNDGADNETGDAKKQNAAQSGSQHQNRVHLSVLAD